MNSNGYTYKGTNAGNAVLYLCTASGTVTNTFSHTISSKKNYSEVQQTPVNLWLTSISTGSSLQFVQQPLQLGYSYIPVRRSEMSLQFTAVWPLRLLNEMNQLSEALRNHYLYALQTLNPIPMKLVYYSTNLDNQNPMVFDGWVKSAPSGVERFKSLFTRNYLMEILIKPLSSESMLPASVYNNTSFIPTAATASQYSGGWYQAISSGPRQSKIIGVN